MDTQSIINSLSNVYDVSKDTIVGFMPSQAQLDAEAGVFQTLRFLSLLFGRVTVYLGLFGSIPYARSLIFKTVLTKTMKRTSKKLFRAACVALVAAIATKFVLIPLLTPHWHALETAIANFK